MWTQHVIECADVLQIAVSAVALYTLYIMLMSLHITFAIDCLDRNSSCSIKPALLPQQ
jgi:hypothetical protein